MKRLIICCMCLLPLWAVAQKTSGLVNYVEVVKVNWTPPADMDPAMKAQIEQMMKNAPKSFSTYKDLTFNQEVALYKISPKQEKIDAERAAQANMEGGGGGGGGMRRMFGGKRGIHHWEIKKGKYTDKRTFFEREFLIKDQVAKLEWKIMGEAKPIAGYVCQKAVARVDTIDVIAWFCPSIPVPAGPDGYGQLPGLILELQSDPYTTVTAEAVELKEVANGDMEEPKGGKVVTKAEYDKIVKEKMDEMRAEWKARSSGGGGGNQIRVIHGQ